jgi:hypothetical protein
VGRVFAVSAEALFFCEKNRRYDYLIEQSYVAEALMWWNGNHAMARFQGGFLVVIRANEKRPRSLGTTYARMAKVGAEAAGR